MSKEKYNLEPIYFCSECLSLAVVCDKEEQCDVCKDCGGTSITKSSMEVWEDKFLTQYGRTYLNIPNKEFRKLVEWV